MNGPQNPNPYQQPQFNPQQTPNNPQGGPHGPSPFGNPLNKLKGPGIGLIIVTILGVINVIAGLVMRLSAGQISGDLSDPTFLGNIIGVAAVGLFHTVIFLGALSMLQGKNFGMCQAAAVMACIPLCTPCVVLGIPFGIWALVVLHQPDVRNCFQ